MGQAKQRGTREERIKQGEESVQRRKDLALLSQVDHKGTGALLALLTGAIHDSTRRS